MGFFSSSKTVKYSDKVWKSSPFCLKGMITDALKAITHGNIPMVISYFSENTESTLRFLAENNVPFLKIENENVSEISTQPKTVFIVDIKLLSLVIKKLPAKPSVDFLFFGHYPLPSKENKILELFSGLSSSIVFYSSLDQPSFEIFNSAQTISLMNAMGLKDEEAIENAMVSKAMLRAREKVESKVKYDHEANSEKEWFLKNGKNSPL